MQVLKALCVQKRTTPSRGPSQKQPIFEHACNFVSHTVFWICVELLQMPRRNTSKEWLRVAASDHLIPRAPWCAIVCHTDEKEVGLGQLGPGHMPNLAWHAAATCKAKDSIPMTLWSFISRSWRDHTGSNRHPRFSFAAEALRMRVDGGLGRDVRGDFATLTRRKFRSQHHHHHHHHQHQHQHQHQHHYQHQHHQSSIISRASSSTVDGFPNVSSLIHFAGVSDNMVKTYLCA